jgi:hypothetical protein
MNSLTSNTAVNHGSNETSLPQWAIQPDLGISLQEAQATSRNKYLPAIIASPIAAFFVIILFYWLITRDRWKKPARPPPPPPPGDPLLHPFESPGLRNLTALNVRLMSEEIKKLANANSLAKDPTTKNRLRILEAHLTCQLCQRLYHNPVSLVQSYPPPRILVPLSYCRTYFQITIMVY